jgi:hypothetical protein
VKTLLRKNLTKKLKRRGTKRPRKRLRRRRRSVKKRRRKTTLRKNVEPRDSRQEIKALTLVTLELRTLKKSQSLLRI